MHEHSLKRLLLCTTNTQKQQMSLKQIMTELYPFRFFQLPEKPLRGVVFS